MASDIEVLLVGPDATEPYKDMVAEETARFADRFEADIGAVRPDDWDHDTRLAEAGIMDAPREFEHLFNYGRGLDARRMSMVLGVKAIDADHEKHYSVYVTDRPMWADDRGDLYTLHGLSKDCGRQGTVILSTYDYDDGGPLDTEAFQALTAHEYGHLFGQESDLIRGGESFVGDGHCDNGDVMIDADLDAITAHYRDDDLYCASCRSDIRETLDERS